MIQTLAISGYRSLREIILPLDNLNLICGPNGSGKTSLYRAITLLVEVAQGRALGALAAEGGLQSTLWAGPEQFSREMKTGRQSVQGTLRKNPVSLRLGFASDDFGYAIDLGLPVQGASMFGRDPEIKSEYVWAGPFLRRSNVLAERKGSVVQILEGGNEKKIVFTKLAPFESMMTHGAHPQSAPELIELRERMRSWRFYDQLRTDKSAPARALQIGTLTTALANDGADLAAALQTIKEIGDRAALDNAIKDAFPDSEIDVKSVDGYFEISLKQYGLLRLLRAAELSDGTLQYVLLAAALLTPRPPELMVLNEPERSLHGDLLAPLARLISKASARSQIIVVTHSALLIDALTSEGAKIFKLQKSLGETQTAGNGNAQWHWPRR